MNNSNKLILGACLGECIHVQGILNFFSVTKVLGYNSTFLRLGIKLPDIIAEIKSSKAEIIAVSYRLTPTIGMRIIDDFITAIRREQQINKRYFLGCLPELANYAKNLSFFEYIFVGGESIDEILSALKEKDNSKQKNTQKDIFYPKDLLHRIEWKKPFPILRAHFGLPSLGDTIKGIEQISNANILDIISIAPDQAAQQYLHNTKELKKANCGAGGVPIRSSLDLQQMFAASKHGNYPLLRIYSGTNELQKNALLFEKTIKNAWPAIPLFWYSELDGRGTSKLNDAISEHLDVIKWYATIDKPIEINDPHQWGLRMAPDVIVVADAYLSAKVAKECGVKTFIQQLMFNTPLGVGLKQDFARVLAMIEITSNLIDKNFRIIRETRAGLSYFSPNETVAKGQLCMSTIMQLAVNPEIIHVVSYCEATHAATAMDIIESSTLIRKIIADGRDTFAALMNDPEIQTRKNQLLQESRVLINGLNSWGSKKFGEKFWLNPDFLTSIITNGFFDAPQLIGSNCALGAIRVKILNGACETVNENDIPLSETDRINWILQSINFQKDQEVLDNETA